MSTSMCRVCSLPITLHHEKKDVQPNTDCIPQRYVRQLTTMDFTYFHYLSAKRRKSCRVPHVQHWHSFSQVTQKGLNMYKARLDPSVRDMCPDCGESPHNTQHLFNCPKHPADLNVKALWDDDEQAARFLGLLQLDD